MDRLNWKVAGTRPETADAATFFLEPVSGPLPGYEAGQFLTLLFPGHDEDIRRSYSISSTPGIDPNLSITVKRVPNGSVSRYLLDHVHTGDCLSSLAPAGRFTIDAKPARQRQFFFFAAGSGITPVFSLIKKVLKEEPISRVFLINQNRNEADTIFRTNLLELQQLYPKRFRIIDFISRPGQEGIPKKLTNSWVEQIVRGETKNHQENLFYLCGPTPFMRMIQFTLRWMGFAEESIRKEFFTIDHIPSPPLLSDNTQKQIVLELNQNVYRFSVAFPKNILQAAIDHHIPIPFSCRAGRCGSCVARCVTGKVVMAANEVLTQKDLEKGLVLTCVGYAATDLSLTL